MRDRHAWNMRLHPRTPNAAAGMLLAVGSAQGADALTFVRMVRDHGIRAEANPFVAALAAGGDLVAMVLVKAALVVLVVAIFAVVVARHPLLACVVATFAVTAGLVGAFSNVAVIAGPTRALIAS
jgi:hypothetical protein